MSNKEIGFMRSLCVGEIREDLIFPYPKMKENEKETFKTLVDSFKQWLGPKRDEFRKWDTAGELPKEILEEMKQFGLFSLITPEEYGGMGFSNTAYSRTLQELAKYDGSVAITPGAHNSIGMKGLVLVGTPEQKAKYLPRLASGELIAAFCLTEPGSGSDAASIKTKAVKVGDHWEISGEKLWITNGEMANFFTVFARTDGPEGKMTAFIVTRDMGGVSNGAHEDKMGIRASSTTSIYFDKVKVPNDCVLGEVGKGFKVAMQILNNGRTGLGGGCVGAMKSCIALSTKQAKERKQFDTPIAEFGLIKQKIGHMMVECYATESIINMLCGMIDAGVEDYSIEAAISKVFASECLWRTADEALQIAAGNGYMKEFPYERMLRDSRINRIFEGTNEILRLFVALNGLQEVGAEFKTAQGALGSVLKDPIKGFGVLGGFTKKLVAARTGLGSPTLKKNHPLLKAESVIFEEQSKLLNLTAQRLIMKHGKNIVGKQFATKRLADIMIDLFALACVISRVSQAIEEKGEKESEKERQIANVFANQCRGRILRNYNKIDNNDDEDIKALADFAYEKEGYIWDNI